MISGKRAYRAHNPEVAGVLPPPSFYEECDRRGICLWQDFMFGCYDHAKGDTVFLENCRAEIEGTIRRLRNHPAVMLWCGGNEQYLWTPTATVSEAKREVFEGMRSEEHTSELQSLS